MKIYFGTKIIVDQADSLTKRGAINRIISFFGISKRVKNSEDLLPKYVKTGIYEKKKKDK